MSASSVGVFFNRFIYVLLVCFKLRVTLLEKGFSAATFLVTTLMSPLISNELRQQVIVAAKSVRENGREYFAAKLKNIFIFYKIQRGISGDMSSLIIKPINGLKNHNWQNSRKTKKWANKFKN